MVHRLPPPPPLSQFFSLWSPNPRIRGDLPSVVAPPWSATPRPDPRFLFYDILEHEQFNKQRKGFMYALTVARSLGRELVLHRLRVRKYDGARSRAQGVYSHGFFSWRRFFNMSQLATGEPSIHEFVRENRFGSSPGLDQSG